MSRSENYELPERTRRKLYDLVPTISFCLIFIVIFFDPEGGTFYRQIERFDGLIASAFAIFAAWITIRQMRESDEKQEARHSELVKFQLVPLENKSIKVIRLSMKATEKCIKSISLFINSDKNDEKINSFIFSIMNIRNFINLFEDKIFEDSREYMNSDIEITFRECKDWAESILLTIPDNDKDRLFNYINSDKFPVWYEDYHYPILYDFYDSALVLNSELEKWLKQFN